MTRQLPDAFTFSSAHEIGTAIKAGDVSARHLLEHYVIRQEEMDGDVNAVIQKDLDRARDRADAADKAAQAGEDWGPFHGVPMTVKESFSLKGLPNTWGLPEFAQGKAEDDALALKRLMAQGVNIWGKTNVPVMLADWQSYNPVYGTTRNPWNLERTPGGSSGGSAAALASGFSALEIGSDIGASIRNPAHYCGVFGHKPTYMLCSPEGHSLGGSVSPTDISVIGPLARSAKDLDIAVQAIAGPDSLEAACWKAELPLPKKNALKDLKIAVMLSDPCSAVDGTYGALLQDLVDKLGQAGATISDTARPVKDTARAFEVYVTLLRAATSGRVDPDVMAEMQGVLANSAPTDRDYISMMARGIMLSHTEWLKLNEERNKLRQDWAAFFEDWDVLICPAAASTAFPHDQEGHRHHRSITVNNSQEPTTHQLFWAGFSGVFYLPSTVAPAGIAKDGLPGGVQIITAHGHDRTSIKVAELIEEAFGGFVAPPAFK